MDRADIEEKMLLETELNDFGSATLDFSLCPGIYRQHTR